MIFPHSKTGENEIEFDWKPDEKDEIEFDWETGTKSLKYFNITINKRGMYAKDDEYGQKSQVYNQKKLKEAVMRLAGGSTYGENKEESQMLYVGRIHKDSNNPVAKIAEHPDGVFAAIKIRKGTLLLAYTGEMFRDDDDLNKLLHKEGVRRLYQFETKNVCEISGTTWIIDGTICRNEMAFANDYRSNAMDEKAKQDPKREENIKFVHVCVGKMWMVVAVAVKDINVRGGSC